MKKKLILCAVAVVCLALALLFGVINFSADNLENRKNGYENAEISPPHGKVFVLDGKYLNNVKVNGKIESICAYLLGSIPSAVWIGKKYYGIDIREHALYGFGYRLLL